MKKILLCAVVVILLIVSFFVFKPKFVLAEDETNPLIMNELYLYNYDTFNLDPNFTDDYLSKVTILPTDIESSNQSVFYGWLKDLGYNNLIVPFYGDEVQNTIDVYMAIPLNGLTASSFQIAYSVQTPISIDFYLIFDDGTRQTWNTETDGFQGIIKPNETNLAKNCYAFVWNARTEDYIPSFKYLGITDSYEWGYEIGYNEGKADGTQTGFNTGYNIGYRDGLAEQGVIIYDDILNFNQLIRNGNFVNSTGWNTYNGTLAVSNNVATLTTAANGTATIYRTDYSTISGHHYLVISTMKAEAGKRLYISGATTNKIVTATGEWQKIIYIDETTNPTTGYPRFGINNGLAHDTIQITNLMLIDLTSMFGEGKEPTIEEATEMFTSTYYEYTAGTPTEIGYYTGYYDGKDVGISEGINIGESNQISQGWIQSIFQAISGFFSIQIFPRVTVGVLVGIPFIITLAWFVIKIFRGGGE